MKLFDSLAHPTLSGQWLDNHKKQDASFESLVNALKRYDFSGACAVGIAGVGDYEHEKFINACKPHESLAPIAGFDPITSSNIAAELDKIKQLGFSGIKLHPRFSNFNLNHEKLVEAFIQAQQKGLIVFLCTYYFTDITNMPIADPFFDIVKLLKQAPKVKLVLVHGGGVDVMRYAELVRFNDNLLLDLSLTLMKYRDSSIWHDLQFLFAEFDRRICIGSDHPEYSHADIRLTVEGLSASLSQEKCKNIFHRNIMSFLE